jgi:hypothetical protein
MSMPTPGLRCHLPFVHACHQAARAREYQKTTQRLKHLQQQLCDLHPILADVLDEFERTSIEMYGARNRGEQPSDMLVFEHHDAAEMVACTLRDLRNGEVHYDD